MKRETCWIFNLTSNFLPFFIPLAARLKAKGLDPWWFNFWPHERLLLTLNGFEQRMIDWKSVWFENSGNYTREQIKKWLAGDPLYYSTPEKDKAKMEDVCASFAAHFIPGVRQLMKKERPCAVLMWNAYKFKEKLMIHACRENDIPTLFFENGFFPDTLQIDSQGINAGSSLAERTVRKWLEHPPEKEPRFEEFIQKKGKLPLPGKTLPPPRQPSFIRRLAHGLKPYLIEGKLYRTIPRTSRPFFTQIKEAQIRKKRASLISPETPKLPDRYIFIPFQVHDDTQIIVHSPWAKSMECVLDSVLKAVTNLGLPHSIVVKEHPVDVGRYDYSGLIKAKNVLWLRNYPLEEILRGAECVITVNSSVGIESLVYQKPLVTLGEAFYNAPGLVYPALKKSELETAISAALRLPGDSRLRESFLCHLRFRDCVEASWRRPTDQGVENAALRILTLLPESR